MLLKRAVVKSVSYLSGLFFGSKQKGDLAKDRLTLNGIEAYVK
jgi:hypothetical protein